MDFYQGNSSMEQTYGTLAPGAVETLFELEHAAQNEPAVTVLLHRTGIYERGTEVMWIIGYPAIREIVVTCPEVIIGPGATVPGVVRTIPVGWRDMASAESFRTKAMSVVASYQAQGWEIKDSHARVDGAA